MEFAFLDTETTGLDDMAQAIEIAVVDEAGAVLFESYCRPTVPVDPEAQAVHGIDSSALEAAPSWPEIVYKLQVSLLGRKLVIFNADFDVRILRQTAKAHGPVPSWIEELQWWPAPEQAEPNVLCAMSRAAYVYGSTNRYGTISLINAAWRAGVDFQGKAHSAAGDAATTAALWAAMKNKRTH